MIQERGMETGLEEQWRRKGKADSANILSKMDHLSGGNGISSLFTQLPLGYRLLQMPCSNNGLVNKAIKQIGVMMEGACVAQEHSKDTNKNRFATTTPSACDRNIGKHDKESGIETSQDVLGRHIGAHWTLPNASEWWHPVTFESGLL